ncbi:S53 family peptidase [Occallatibacter riparius]|uniref:Protease pro-enzyme activation domain-containing protein n=1 Tax=Occallatibacter riparius TaxID=1002689 RepID=A0A9J7BY40_9BACT|nr:protease pro-enzyme activation domain-containing protein [Occallatibacter riparius]UWZ86261.1 protease pro-enzyme activation domain-containing protein [Occallatibacter riparius]
MLSRPVAASRARSALSITAALSKARPALAATFLLASSLALSAQTPRPGFHQPLPEPTLRIPDHTPPQIANGTAIFAGHYAPEKMLRLAVALKPPHPVEEEQFLHDLTDKNSPEFHHFLTAEEWNARFSPSAADEEQVLSWARAQGLTITNRYPNRLLVDLEAPAGVLEKVFGVTINSYKVGNDVAYSNDRDPLLPANLHPIVNAVLGMNTIQRMRPSNPKWDAKLADYVPGPAHAEAGSAHGNGKAKAAPMAGAPASNAGGPATNMTNGYIDPSNIYSSQTYNYGGLWNLGHCCNPFHVAGPVDGGSPKESSIAIAAWGDWSISDYQGFAAQYGLAYNLNGWYIDGQPAGGPNGETMLDSEWTTATANSYGSWADTAHIYVYMDGTWSQAGNADMFNQMLNDGYARVFTTSWSCTESTGCSTTATNAWHTIFNSMVGQGWTLLTASGDRGSTDDCYFNNPAHTSVAYPASDPDFVGVGGTSLTLNASGNWVSETGWQGGTSANSCYYNNGGSGGGQSVVFGRPSYQDYYSGATGRLVPDISLNAWGATEQNYYFGGGLHPTGGTSIASPEMAGFFAQENAYLLYIGSICGASYNSACAPYGQPNAALYDEGLNNRSQHNPFYDITTGCNSNDQTATYSLTSYCSHSSYDLVTGWGTANMMQLAWSLNWELLSHSANGVPYLTWTGPAVNHWYNTSQTVSWTVNDYKGNEGPNGTGIAGFWQSWDTPPTDSTTKAHGGSGDLFYSGPQYPNAVNGCLSFVNGANGCAGGVSQGCHTAYAVGWNNEGWTTASFGQSYSYGPICYDYTPPQTLLSISRQPTLPRATTRKYLITLNASDQYSGIAATWIYISGGGSPSLGWQLYRGPFEITVTGPFSVYWESQDNAGNWESLRSASI